MVPEALLQMLLFVDKRPTSQEDIHRISLHLENLRKDYPFELQIIDVGEHPSLAEHFKLVATPTLIKLSPEPREVLAGFNLVAQVEQRWSRWQEAMQEYLDEYLEHGGEVPCPGSARNSMGGSSFITYSAEMIQLSDEIFRLKQEKEALAEQLHFKDRLIAILAHELRNPLTAISIALETLEMGNDPEHGYAAHLTGSLIGQLLKHARTQTRTIDRMISDLLQTAHSADVQLSLRLQKIDLSQLCRETLDALGDRFCSKSLHVQADIPSDLPAVYADAERVRQVLTNLLENAVKYTPEQGTIQLNVLHRTTQKIQVSICDNGPGVPAENQQHIFEDNYRLQRDKETEGYGIGLSLCQRIIRAHYGKIWVDSAPNQGSCFHFTLPVYRP